MSSPHAPVAWRMDKQELQANKTRWKGTIGRTFAVNNPPGIQTHIRHNKSGVHHTGRVQKTHTICLQRISQRVVLPTSIMHEHNRADE